MAKAKKNKPFRCADAILCADIHLRDDNPVCRKDDFVKNQFLPLISVASLQQIHRCPVLHSGDLFHKAKPSLFLVAKTMAYLPEMFWTVYGNHDLPNHNYENRTSSGMYCLEMAGALRTTTGCHWGQKPEDMRDPCSFVIKDRKVLLWHVLTYKGDAPFPDCMDLPAQRLMVKYPQYDLIVTGDNHVPFTHEYDGRLLVNPGSLTRQTANQIDHRPRVYLYYADTNTVEPVYMAIDKDAITREHIDVIEKRDAHIDAFIESLDTKGLEFADFDKNLTTFLHKNRVRKKIVDIIYELTKNEH